MPLAPYPKRADYPTEAEYFFAVENWKRLAGGQLMLARIKGYIIAAGILVALGVIGIIAQALSH